MKEYNFEQIDIMKIAYLLGIIPQIKIKYEIWDKDLEIFEELHKQVRRIYRKNLKPENELKQKKWEAKQNLVESQKQIFESVEKWNSEMTFLSKKYNYISLNDFYGNIKNIWQSRPSHKLNLAVSVIAKRINIPLLFKLNIGYGEVKLTNLYPEKWLETNAQDIFEKTEKNILIDIGKYRR